MLGGRVLVMRVWEGPENVVFAAHSRALQLTATRLTLLQAANAFTLHTGQAVAACFPGCSRCDCGISRSGEGSKYNSDRKMFNSEECSQWKTTVRGARKSVESDCILTAIT